MKNKLNLILLIGLFIVMGLASVTAQPPLTTIFADGGIEISYPHPQYLKYGEDLFVTFWAYNTSQGKQFTNSTINCTYYLLNDKGENILRLQTDDGIKFNYGLVEPGRCQNCFYALVDKGNLSYNGIYEAQIKCLARDGGAIGGYLNTGYEVTPSGSEFIQSQSPLLYILIGLTFVFALFFFALGVMYPYPASRIIFFSLAGIMLVVAILYSLVIAEQLIPQQLVIIDGLATLWSVIKILVGIFLVLLVLFALYMSYWSWLKKRGRRD
jgi:hypothetical protein